jgi:hypothetical protein
MYISTKQYKDEIGTYSCLLTSWTWSALLLNSLIWVLRKRMVVVAGAKSSDIYRNNKCNGLLVRIGDINICKSITLSDLNLSAIARLVVA